MDFVLKQILYMNLMACSAKSPVALDQDLLERFRYKDFWHGNPTKYSSDLEHPMIRGNLWLAAPKALWRLIAL